MERVKGVEDFRKRCTGILDSALHLAELIGLAERVDRLEPLLKED